jgi:hypothetical protein
VSARTGTLTIAGQTLTVSQDGRGAQEVSLKGEIVGLNGTCPSLSFMIEGQPVRTDGSTRYDKKSCGSMKEGLEIEVRGIPKLGGWVLATVINPH